MAKKKRATAKKTTAKTTALVPQAHGGALKAGGTPGNAGGTGRPTDQVRRSLLEIAQGKGIPFLDNLMAGEVDVRFFGTCRKCGDRQELPADDDSVKQILDEIGETVRASIDHRLKGADLTLKLSVPKVREVSTEEVKAKVEAMLNVLKEQLEPELYQRLLPELRQAFLTA